jgi:catechol 2,3-dioxygenase-like lactoylglutathione lyase family enzyme
MKRLHIHIGVENIQQAIPFYSALFGAAPVKTKADYAKWLLDDPRVNFAISTRPSKKGIDHLGIQVDDNGELDEVRGRITHAGLPTFDEGETVCCYAKSDKTWVQDPAGVAWETYRTMEDAEIYGKNPVMSDSACCTPETKGTPNCCEPSEQTAGCCG